MIASLNEGTYRVGLDKKFIPVAPDATPTRGTFKLAINPFLIRDDEITALIDAGMGPYGPQDHHALMTANLEKHGLKPEDIQHVFCSHLHTDHIGGLLHEQYGTYTPTFPNASIWLSGRDWELFMAKAKKKRHTETVRWAHFLEAHADLRFVEEQEPVTNAIQMITIGGHTRYHQAVLYHGKTEKAMMLGDVLGRAEVINRRFAGKYDFDGIKSQQLREQYLRMAYEEKYYLLTYHGDKGAIAVLKNYDQQKGYYVEHITTGIVGSPD